MNKQIKPDGTRKIEWTDFTWNPIAGCFHNCRWTMPDGNEVICYAEAVAERFRSDKAYPQGFAHSYWHPERLNEPAKKKKGVKIFVGSMADVFGHWVHRQHIEAVLQVARECPQHIFQMLTKNPIRAKQFDLPANVWLGASMPPDSMWGKPLTQEKKNVC